MLRKYKNHFVLKQLYYAVVNHPTPSNLTYAWNFGSLAFLCLMIQFITGISLAMHYIPHISMAFASVEHIMRDVHGGWLIRYGHANGASMFFIVVYIHIFRGLYYTSYTWPRQAVWVLGVVLLLLMIITAFMGYVLPWGQMSFWGATVITNLFSAIPYVGQDLVIWLWGNHSVSASTLTRFYALHFTMPFIILGVAVIHVIVLQYFGSNNPLGVHFMIDSIPFTPYYLLKDLFGFALFFAFFAGFIFFAPNMLNHPDNYIPANSTVTPPHIVPEWYFLPFYAVLRSVPNKIGGVLLMLSSILVLFLLPFISVAEIRSFQFRTFSRYWFWLMVGVCVLLGWIGGQPAAQPFVILSGCLTGSYFFLLLVGLPVIERVENYLLFEQRSQLV